MKNDDLVSEIQAYLSKESIDGWLIYDNENINPLGSFILGESAAFMSRRWLYFIPATGEPVFLFHRIEPVTGSAFPGTTVLYQGWQDFHEKIKDILKNKRRVALEYSPMGALPSISRVDAGTFELLKQCGIEPVSSGELIQHFTCRLSEEQLISHRSAVRSIYEIRDRVLESIRQDLCLDYYPTEYQVQQRLVAAFDEFGMESEFPPIVAVGPHSGNPHYQPSPEDDTRLTPGSLLLLDMWARQRAPGSIYADITWMVHLGTPVPDEIVTVFSIVRDARDAVVDFLNNRFESGQKCKGYEADDVARNSITQHGYGQYFTHRTGHNLGRDVHGPGANLDNLETHENRYLIPETAFTIEPGIYLKSFGVRSEIDVYYDSHHGFCVTTPPQKNLTVLSLDKGEC